MRRAQSRWGYNLIHRGGAEDAEGGHFCLSGDDDKQKDSYEKEKDRKAYSLEAVCIQILPKGQALSVGALAPVTRYKTYLPRSTRRVYNLLSFCVLRALRGDILPRMLCPSEIRDGVRSVVFAQSPSPDWAKQIFSANSASLRLLLNSM